MSVSDADRLVMGLKWPGWRWWLARLIRRERASVVVGLYAWWLYQQGRCERV